MFFLQILTFAGAGDSLGAFPCREGPLPQVRLLIQAGMLLLLDLSSAWRLLAASVACSWKNESCTK